MTKREFLKLYEKYNKNYISQYVDTYNPIRFISNKTKTWDALYKSYCPITLVCNSLNKGRFTVGNFDKAAKALGLNKDTAQKIVDAADYDYKHDLQLRKELINRINTSPKAS